MISAEPRPPYPWGRLLAWLALGAMLAITLAPLAMVLKTALEHPQTLLAHAADLLPAEPTLLNFKRVLGLVDADASMAVGGSGAEVHIGRALVNSLVFTTLVVVLQTANSAMAAYAFARLQFPGKRLLFAAVVGSMILPGVVLFIPNFITIKQLGWLNSMAGMVAPFALISGFSIFFLRQFFLSLPRDLEEAALLDGAGPFTIFRRVVLPLSTTPLATVAMLSGIGAWNEFFWPFIVAPGEESQVLPVALQQFKSQTPQGQPDWTGLMAAATLNLLPTLALLAVFGRRVVYWTTLSTGLVAETAPDVFTNHLSKYPDLVANGQLVDLSPFMRRDGVDLARYEPGLAAPWGRDGKQYGLPKDWDTVALLVNLDHARAQGVTLDELRAMRWNPQDGGSFGQVIARLTRDAAGRNALQPGFDKARVQVVGYQNPGPGGMSGQTEWGPFAVSAGFRYQAAPWDAALRYDDPVLAATLTWLAGLPARGLSLPPQAVGKLGMETLFAAGRAAMVPAGAWMVGHYAKLLAQQRLAYAWVPMPMGPTGERASMRNGLADSIWIGGKHPEAAWAWVRHLATPDCQRKLAAAGAVFPAIAGMAQQTLDVFRQRGVDATAFDVMAKSRSFAPPIVENAAEVDALIGQAIERVLLGRAEAVPALAAANAKARALARR